MWRSYILDQIFALLTLILPDTYIGPFVKSTVPYYLLVIYECLHLDSRSIGKKKMFQITNAKENLVNNYTQTRKAFQ